MKLLLVEDERNLSKAIVTILRMNEYEVDTVENGIEAINIMKENYYDGIISDIMMPKMDGIAFLENLRENGDFTPVLLLTAKAEIDDRVKGMDAGANDYLPKPFAMKELLARIRMMLRVSKHNEYDKISFDNITLSVESLELKGEYASVILNNREGQLLALFLHNPGKCIDFATCQNLIKAENDEELDIYISYINNKLKAVQAKFIVNKMKNCYRLEV